jgi:hypothetical protein
MTTKTKKQAKVELFGENWYGDTKAEAKAKAMQAADKLFRELGSPTFITYKGESVCIYRTTWGWSYAFLRNQERTCVRDGKELYGPDFTGPDLSGGLTMGWVTEYSDILEAAWAHLIGNKIDILDLYEDSQIPYQVKGQRRKDLLSNAAFQRAYRHIKYTHAGAGENFWHQWACENQYLENFKVRPQSPESPTRANPLTVRQPSLNGVHNAPATD